jgi:cysteine desulfurase
MKRIYLDYAASTPLDTRVKEAMDPFWNESFANPSSIHKEGAAARMSIEQARTQVAQFLNAYTSEIVFTSSATEANTLVVRGVFEAVAQKNKNFSFEGLHFVTSAIEHQSVREATQYVQAFGGEVSVIPVDKEGRINVKELESSLRTNTLLVSCMLVNSEIGVVQPIEEISRIIKQHNEKNKNNSQSFSTLFHSDAAQAGLFIPMDVRSLGVDFLTIDAHKMYGPKGIAALYVKKGIHLYSLFLGSKSKKNMPSGTPAVPLIVGLGKTVEIISQERKVYEPKIRDLRDYFIYELEKRFPNVRINGSKSHRIAHNISVTFSGVNHEFLQIQLDEKGVSCATKSACLESGDEGSYVISAITEDQEKDALRFTLGKETTKEEIDTVIKTLHILLT